MRTILALDEMLIRAVRPKLPGTVEPFSRQRMRKEGVDAVRDAALASASAVVIGGRKWTAAELLPVLERWKLPYEVPVVMVVPEISDAEWLRAVRLDVFAVVEDVAVKNVASCLSVEARLASRWLSRRGRLLRHPVLLHRDRRPSSPDRPPGRLIPLLRAVS